jgi:hypothetical protein
MIKWLLVFLVLFVALPVVAQQSQLSEKDLSIKVYTVKFKDVEDVVTLISPLLSDFGSLTVQPKLKTITAQDFPLNLNKIGEAIKGYDLPPKNVEVIINLIMASEMGEKHGSIAKEIRGVSETLSDFTKWTDYERIGSVVMTSVEGGESASTIGERYRVKFTIEYVNETRRVIKFSQFSLEKRTLSEGGDRYGSLWKWETGPNLVDGKLLVVGAAKQPGSKKALFLTIQANIK